MLPASTPPTGAARLADATDFSDALFRN